MHITHKNQMVVWFAIVVVVITLLVVVSMKGRTVTSPEDVGMMNGGEGVKVAIVVAGTGAGAVVGDTVSVNYMGILADGTIFDSNVDPKFNHVEPFTFVLGEGSVIPGWEVGVVGMKVGERRILEVNPEYAYGAGGYPGVIPPNAVLTFQIELVSIEK